MAATPLGPRLELPASSAAGSAPVHSPLPVLGHIRFLKGRIKNSDESGPIDSDIAEAGVHPVCHGPVERGTGRESSMSSSTTMTCL